MPKRTRRPIRSRRADKAVARAEDPETELHRLPLQKLTSHKATNGKRKTALGTRAASQRLAESISRAHDLRREAQSVRHELQRQRTEAREARAKCLRHIRNLCVRKEYVKCGDFGWYHALYSSLYQGIEVTLLNFDSTRHLQECMRVAKVFESAFTMVPDLYSRTVHFVRYFGPPKASPA